MADYISSNIEYDRWGKNAKKICDKMLDKAKEKEPVSTRRVKIFLSLFSA